MSELKWKWVYIPYLDTPEIQKESAIKAGYTKVYFKSEVDTEIESLKASHYAEMVDAGMRERRLNYKYWNDKADEAAKMKRLIQDGEIIYLDEYCNEKDWRIMHKVWEDEETKCRAKAEQYK